MGMMTVVSNIMTLFFFLSHEKIGKLLGVKIEFSSLFLIELSTQKRVLITDY